MEAFKHGASISADGVFLLIAGIGCSLALLWYGWTLLSMYRGWSKGNVDDDIFGVAALRGVLLLLLLLWLFLS